MWVRGHSRSLKVVPFESLGTVSHSPSIVTMAASLAISEILSVKQWPVLEIWVWDRSRSLKMARFDRPYDFLLVRYCNYSSILYRLRVIWRWIISWPWNLAKSSLIETGVIRKLGFGFLCAFCSNYGRTCSHLWDIYRQRVVWAWKQG